MNYTESVSGALAAHHILLVGIDRFEDWKAARCPLPEYCPLAAMADLLHSTLRLVLVILAAVALALVGIALSVLAYMKEIYRFTARRKSVSSEAARSPPSSRAQSRDRDVRPTSTHKPNSRRTPTKVGSRSPQTTPSPQLLRPTADVLQLKRAELASSSSPKRRKHNVPQRLVSLPLEKDMPSIEEAVESAKASRTSNPPEAPERDLPASEEVPTQAFSDFSPIASTAPSIASLSSGEQEMSPITSRSVLQKIKDHRRELRERRCMVARAQSLPAPRTNPYQAPYFFPSPMSPEAGTYVQDLKNERRGVGRAVDEVGVVDQVQFASPLPSPKSVAPALPTPSIIVTDLQTEGQPVSMGEAQAASPAASERHRWSWHMPLRPKPSHRPRSVESDLRSRASPEKGDTPQHLEHKERFPKLKFGHHRRRNGVGSGDTQASTRS